MIRNEPMTAQALIAAMTPDKLGEMSYRGDSFDDCPACNGTGEGQAKG